jgi:hypothetical protein
MEFYVGLHERERERERGKEVKLFYTVKNSESDKED